MTRGRFCCHEKRVASRATPDYRQNITLCVPDHPAHGIITSTENCSSGFHGISSLKVSQWGSYSLNHWGAVSRTVTSPLTHLQLRYSMVHLTNLRWVFFGNQAGDEQGAWAGDDWLWSTICRQSEALTADIHAVAQKIP